MTLWPTTLTLRGVSLPLAGVLADVTIHHGRQSIFDEATASTMQLTLLGVSKTFAQDLKPGDPVVLTVADGAGTPFPRFTGLVTDAALDVDELTLIATGKLSTLTRYVIGTADWPAESWSARVTRAFTEAGLSSLLDLRPDPLFNPTLAARVAATTEPTTVGDYLNFLAPMVGAAVADTPAGKVLVQAIGSRSLASALALAPADVAYAPVWQQTLPDANLVEVSYGADMGGLVTVQDSSSIAVYGKRQARIDTTCQNAADATTRGQTRLSRGSFPHWNIPEAPVIRGLPLAVGQPIQLSSMPPSSPYEPWQPVLEGWSDTITGDEWTMSLALSDPLASGLVLLWNLVPAADAAYRWNTVDVATDWTEALTLEALHAG